MPSRPTHTDDAIRTHHLRKQYREVLALDDLSMAIPRGEIFGFLGPNGAGKTTAVKLLLGLVRPTFGHGTVLGAPLGDRATRRRIGYLPELFRYQEWLTAAEVLALHCELMGLPRSEWQGNVNRALVTVSLDARRDDRVGTFSKGMQQRLGLGTALLGDPDLVILDEPTSALDPVGRYEVREMLRQVKERGGTVFLNSHLLTEVERVCDRAIVLHQGQAIAGGTMRELIGGVPTLRIRATGLSPEGEEVLKRSGAVERSEGDYLVRGVEEEAIPGLIEDLVRSGARLYAVEPGRETLEERFLHLLRESPDAP